MQGLDPHPNPVMQGLVVEPLDRVAGLLAGVVIVLIQNRHDLRQRLVRRLPLAVCTGLQRLLVGDALARDLFRNPVRLSGLLAG